MKTKIILSISFILLLFISCDTSKKEAIDIKSIKIEGVNLDNSERWQANKETTEGVIKMQTILNDFSKTASTEEYKTLKIDLEGAFSEVFQKCTMKGESHNQLHNYLKPMLPMFDALESMDSKVREKNYDILGMHLMGYINYFE